jgi:hypothetical protein
MAGLANGSKAGDPDMIPSCIVARKALLLSLADMHL